MEDTPEEVPPMSRRKIQEVDCGVDQYRHQADCDARKR